MARYIGRRSSSLNAKGLDNTGLDTLMRVQRVSPHVSGHELPISDQICRFCVTFGGGKIHMAVIQIRINSNLAMNGYPSPRPSILLFSSSASDSPIISYISITLLIVRYLLYTLVANIHHKYPILSTASLIDLNFCL